MMLVTCCGDGAGDSDDNIGSGRDGGGGDDDDDDEEEEEEEEDTPPSNTRSVVSFESLRSGKTSPQISGFPNKPVELLTLVDSGDDVGLNFMLLDARLSMTSMTRFEKLHSPPTRFVIER
jgi:hypothetical protein